MESRLLSCPTDVLNLALALLSPHDLCTACLVCKGLRILAEPLLYSSIHLRWTKSQLPKLDVLVKAIFRRPQLAVQVRTANFEDDTVRHDFASGKIAALEVSTDGLEALIEFIDRTRVPSCDVWIRETRRGSIDAFVALFLCLVPNLTCLHLGQRFTRESQLVGMIFTSSLCKDANDQYELPAFRSLREVSMLYYTLAINIRRRTANRNTADILPLFYLPSIENITASIDNPATFTWPGRDPPNAKKLECLDLTMMREGHLGNLLQATRQLRTLRWDWYYRRDLNDDFVTPTIDLNKLAAALLHVRPTLESLTIEAATDVADASPEFPPIWIEGALRNLVTFSKLKKLEIPLPFLLGLSPDTRIRLEDVVPGNIEVLTITDDLFLQQEYEWTDEDILDVLRRWLMGSKTYTPRLRKIYLLLRYEHDEWGREMSQKLEDLCYRAGIRAQITKSGRDLSPD